MIGVWQAAARARVRWRTPSAGRADTRPRHPEFRQFRITVASLRFGELFRGDRYMDGPSGLHANQRIGYSADDGVDPLLRANNGNSLRNRLHVFYFIPA